MNKDASGALGGASLGNQLGPGSPGSILDQTLDSFNKLVVGYSRGRLLSTGSHPDLLHPDLLHPVSHAPGGRPVPSGAPARRCPARLWSLTWPLALPLAGSAAAFPSTATPLLVTVPPIFLYLI